MKIIAINRDVGSAFVKDENNNKMYRVDINPIPLFVEINEEAYSSSKAFMHGYEVLLKPVYSGDRKAVFKYVAKEWCGKNHRKLSEKEYYDLKRERLGIILKRASEKGIRNVIIKKVRNFIKNKEFKMAELYLEILLNIKNISEHAHVRANSELYNEILNLKKEFNNERFIMPVSPQKTMNNKPKPTKKTINELLKHKNDYRICYIGC
jgi:uncharacterized protein YdiU (UPF0061 family)